MTSHNSRLGRKIRAILAERFPNAITAKDSGRQKRPLKLGIHKDILSACPELSKYQVHCALHEYTRGPSYARTMVAGAVRIDLDGHPTTVISDADSAPYLEWLERMYGEKAA